MGNSLGGFSKYWQAFRQYPRLQGGFVWDWVDQSLIKYDEEGHPWSAYGGDFGDTPNDRQFCMNGLVFADRTPHPALTEAKHAQQFFQFRLLERKIEVTSEYMFRHSDNEILQWSLAWDGNTVASGEESLDIAACSTQVITLPEYPLSQMPGQLWLTVQVIQPNATAWSEAGHISAWQQWLIAENLSTESPTAASCTPDLSIDDAFLAWSQVINVGNLTAIQVFSANTGLMTSRSYCLRLWINLPVRRWTTILVSAKPTILILTPGWNAGKPPGITSQRCYYCNVKHRRFHSRY